MRLLFLSLFCILLSGCQSSRVLSDIPMQWLPTSDIYRGEASSKAVALFNEKIKVLPFTDLRENKQEIGKNSENSTPRIVTTKDDIAQWCTDQFKIGLLQLGVTVVASDETLILKSEVVRFYVSETYRYSGNVGIKITAERPDGRVIWQGLASGSENRFGRSYTAESYYNALSDSLAGAVLAFVANGSLPSALTK